VSAEGWNHACCDECWSLLQPERLPARLAHPEPETCCWCSQKTLSGIYVRQDSRVVPCSAWDEVERLRGGQGVVAVETHRAAVERLTRERDEAREEAGKKQASLDAGREAFVALSLRAEQAEAERDREFARAERADAEVERLREAIALVRADPGLSFASQKALDGAQR